jgi:cobalamin synthase
VTALLVVGIATVVAGPAVALGVAWGVAAGAALSAWVILRRGQLDGDGYGAVIELTFLACLTGVTIAGALA